MVREGLYPVTSPPACQVRCNHPLPLLDFSVDGYAMCSAAETGRSFAHPDILAVKLREGGGVAGSSLEPEQGTAQQRPTC